MKLKYGLPALAMLVAQAAHADDAATAPGEKKTWKGSMELGVLVTSGNSKATNINGKLNVTQDMEHWRNTYNLESLYTDSDEETTAERYRGAVQGDYKFNDKEFWYVRGAYEKDRFSGYDYQSSVSTGYGNRFWQVEDGSFLKHRLVLVTAAMKSTATAVTTKKGTSLTVAPLAAWRLSSSIT